MVNDPSISQSSIFALITKQQPYIVSADLFPLHYLRFAAFLQGWQNIASVLKYIFFILKNGEIKTSLISANQWDFYLPGLRPGASSLVFDIFPEFYISYVLVN